MTNFVRWAAVFLFFLSREYETDTKTLDYNFY